MADVYPYRNAATGQVQELGEDVAALFPGAFERLPDGWESMTDEQIAAHAQLDGALADGSDKTKAARDAKAAADAADAAAADAGIAPVPPVTTTPTPGA